MRLGLEGLPVDGVSARTFEEEWPDLARRLHSMLAGKRIPAGKREDIVQETGLRLFRMWAAVDPERPVWALAVTIALNLVRDEARRGIGREVLGFVPDIANPHEDVERSGLARIELGRVERALLELTPAHRSILLAEVGDAEPATDRGPNAVKMLRMRARRRLHSLLDATTAGSAAFVGRIRVSLGLDRHMHSLRSAGDLQQYQLPAVAGVLAMMSILAAIPAGNGTFGSPDDPAGPFDGDGGKVQIVLASAPDMKVSGSEASIGSSALKPVRYSPKAKSYRPYRVPVPQDVGWLEGEAEVGVFGMGAQLGERDGKPGCIFGMPVREGGPEEFGCSSPAKGGRSDEPIYARGKARGRIGSHRWSVEV